MFYWAKTGEFEKFFRAAIKYNICCFSRIGVVYKRNRRSTIARYHVALKEDEVSSDDSDRIGKKMTPRTARSPARKKK